MKTQSESIQFYADKPRALEAMRVRNQAHANGDRAVFVVTDGPEDNFAVMPLRTAIEMDFSYQWEAR